MENGITACFNMLFCLSLLNADIAYAPVLWFVTLGMRQIMVQSSIGNITH